MKVRLASKSIVGKPNSPQPITRFDAAEEAPAPVFSPGVRQSSSTLGSLSKEITDHYLKLLRTLGWTRESNRLVRLAFTSCDRGVGVSLVSKQLAMTIANLSQRVLLVEIGPRTRNRLAGSTLAGGGFSDHLRNADLANTVHPTELPNLFIMSPGAEPLPDDISEKSVVEALETLSAAFDIVIYDLPPIFPTEEAFPWIQFMKPLVLILVDDTSSERLTAAVNQVMCQHGEVAGVVRNRAESTGEEPLNT